MGQSQLSGALSDRLRDREARTVTEWEATPAAVLVPLYLEAGDWHLLFTRRTDDVDSHRGQVSFPGGAIEHRDPSEEEAALREAREEIGLPSEGTHVLGRLDSLLTVTQFHVTPVVAAIPWPYDIQLNPNEVATAFGVPLSWLLDEGNLRLELREGTMIGKPMPVYHYAPYDGEVIWGVTARITVDLLDHIRSLEG